ncbi:phage tail assembly protein [Devosia ginsengisoli]|uniref:phage tail assembly protein n=1 Tax=Devosia ginsengisoli TaxID=400770 RepID=UPI0026F19ED5|nr:phage tail assembly protein [Devosia ginsengisoli]MCR6672208.1 phage tail assembly protein [Devosia ginsengisoli]
MKKTVTVPLSEKVEHDGKTYTELTFRPMKARDALVAEGEESQVMAGYKLFAALADVPVEVILDLEMVDLAKVGEGVAPLMGKLPDMTTVN